MINGSNTDKLMKKINYKFKNEEYVNVDRTLIKNVKKITGAKPGLVTYTGQKTVKQKIDKVFIGQLLTNDNN